MKSNEVNTAFEILLEEIELVANSLNEEGAEAFRTGNYDSARRAIEEATRLAEFREKVKALQKEWASLAVNSPRRNPTWHARSSKTLTSSTSSRLVRRPRTKELKKELGYDA